MQAEVIWSTEKKWHSNRRSPGSQCRSGHFLSSQRTEECQWVNLSPAWVYFAVGAVALLIGLYFLRGASHLVRFAFSEDSSLARWRGGATTSNNSWGL
jgi:hypothetical protein